jgi:hypothetical protein
LLSTDTENPFRLLLAKSLDVKIPPAPRPKTPGLLILMLLIHEWLLAYL